MFTNTFMKNREAIEEQYRAVRWIEGSGLAPEALLGQANALRDTLAGEGFSRPLIKARVFEFILDRAQLAVTPEELFQDHIRHEFILQKQRREWEREVNAEEPLKSMVERGNALGKAGLGDGINDFGHTVPDWYDIMELGLPGLRDRLSAARAEKEARGTLAPEQADFYEAGRIVYEAFIRYALRLADACDAAQEGAAAPEKARLAYCSADLRALAGGAPETLHQALQLAYLFHILQEEIEGERLRSLGGLDRVYDRFLTADLAAGRLSEAQAEELFMDFFQKFHALTGDTLFGEPMYLGGTLPDGRSAVNDCTYLILRAYDKLGLANPKFHIRVSKDTPSRFVRAVLACIRGGNSSFVFCSDDCAIPMMLRLGVTLEEAREWVPIGCYEPGILGREVACTGNGGFSLPKCVELALNDGVDMVTGERLGPATGRAEDFASFDQLMDAVRAQMTAVMDFLMDLIREREKRYMRINPSPLFSATLRECVEAGKDAYAAGAKYNNSSLYVRYNGTAADELAMIKKWVYDRKELTLPRLVEILRSDWAGEEKLRLRMKADPDKWGNDRELPDTLCKEILDFCAAHINGQKNARGGVFKPAAFSIDRNYADGERLAASADGRRKGEIASRNLGASSTMDRQGVTAHIRSVTKLDHAAYPTGSVLDLVLHPSAVAGEDGMDAFESLVRSYFALGGYAVHFNVLDSRVLERAQREPEKFKNLQVRVCGWNVYFVNLSRGEQDELIARARCQEA